MKDNIGQIYLLGDLLKKSSAILRGMEADELRERGFEVYSAIEDKTINDKNKQTVESNNRLHSRIVEKDVNGILNSKTIVGAIDESSIGSICEVSQIEMFNRLYDMIDDLYQISNDMAEFGQKVKEMMDGYGRKQVLIHVDDLRCTNIEERGFYRSYYINQYLHGVIISAMNKAGACACDDDIQGIMTWEEIINKLQELNKDNN